jgi:hypothetical protein
VPEGERCELSDEFLKMRRLVLRERARRERVLVENARIKAEDVAKMLKEDSTLALHAGTGLDISSQYPLHIYF